MRKKGGIQHLSERERKEPFYLPTKGGEASVPESAVGERWIKHQKKGITQRRRGPTH